MSLCGDLHPETKTPCDMPEGQHEWHTGFVPGIPPEAVEWKNEDYTPTVRTRTKSQRGEHSRDLVQRVAEYNGAPRDSLLTAVERKAIWVDDATKVLRRYCIEHEGDFTTAEDIWPLLDAPDDMRSLGIAVNRAVKSRWMREERGERLRDTYQTRDGVQFKENKLCPIYRSRIYRDPAFRD